jgi:hypothetical protein
MFLSQRHANDGSHDGCYDRADVTPLPVRHPPVGGPAGYALLLTGGVAEIFGTGTSLALSIPGGLPEVALGIWLIIKGFNADGYAGGRSRPTRTWHQGCERPRGLTLLQELGARREPRAYPASRAGGQRIRSSSLGRATRPRRSFGTYSFVAISGPATQSPFPSCTTMSEVCASANATGRRRRGFEAP